MYGWCRLLGCAVGQRKEKALTAKYPVVMVVPEAVSKVGKYEGVNDIQVEETEEEKINK